MFFGFCFFGFFRYDGCLNKTPLLWAWYFRGTLIFLDVFELSTPFHLSGGGSEDLIMLNSFPS